MSSARLQIREAPDALVLNVVKAPSLVEVALFSLGFAALLGFTFGWIGAVLGGGLGYAVSQRWRTAELRVTNRAFVATQRFGPGDSVARENLRYLEYKDAALEDGEPRPCGLYARLDAGDACLLPYLDEPQVNTAIEAIYKRYPDIPLANLAWFDQQLSCGE